MKLIPFSASTFVPAAHENPLTPGVLKKTLVGKALLQPGCVQMINWAILPAGKQFAKHYHESMQEVFIIISGETEITIGTETTLMHRGDTVLIDAGEVHQMRNESPEPVEYLAVGITRETGGKTVVVEE